MTEKVQAEPVHCHPLGSNSKEGEKNKGLGAFPVVPAARTGDDKGHVAA